MVEYIVICITAIFASGLTFFSGFGLGTILVPVFALFFPVELAIVMTAIVHFLNNLFKLSLTAKHINWTVVFLFGMPSILAAYLGANMLLHINTLDPLFSYHLANHTFFITPINLLISILLTIFALIEMLPVLKGFSFPPKYLIVGGVLSGFFGGLSGHQGALRSMFLIKSNLTKQSFIATGIVIACMIDTSRLIVYSKSILGKSTVLDYSLLIAATLSAFLGAYIGNRILNKITIHTLQYFVSIMLLLFSVALGLGILS